MVIRNVKYKKEKTSYVSDLCDTRGLILPEKRSWCEGSEQAGSLSQSGYQ